MPHYRPIIVCTILIVLTINLFSQPERLFGLGKPKDVCFVNKDTAVFAISERAIAVTYDGWESFHYAELRDWKSTERNLIRTVTMNENGNGYILGAGQAVWKTTDYGQSFQIVSGFGGGSGGGTYVRYSAEDEIIYSQSGAAIRTDANFGFDQFITALEYQGFLKKQFSGDFLTISSNKIKHIDPHTYDVTEFDFGGLDATYIDSNTIYTLANNGFNRRLGNGNSTYGATLLFNQSMEFVNADTGIISYSSGIRVTHDSGNTWITTTYAQLKSNLGYLFSDMETICWVSPTEVYIFGDDGAIIFSSDAGVSWTLKHYFGNQHFGDDISGVVSDTLGNLYVGAYSGTGISTDSGETWNYVQYTQGGTNEGNYFAIHHWSPERAIASSNNGNNTVKTTNGWDNVTSTISKEFEDFAFVDAGLGFGIGYHAWHRTTDSGNTWTALSGLQSLDGHKIEFHNGFLGMAAANYGVYVSSDSGDSWSATNFSSTKVEDISIVNDTIAWAINSGGSMYKTIDQGATWTFVELIGDYGKSIATHGANKIVGVGLSGIFTMSSDSGNNWVSGTIGTYADLVDIEFYHNDFYMSDDYCSVFRLDSCLAYIEPRQDTLCDEPNLVYEVFNLPSGNRTWSLNGTILFSGTEDTILIVNPKQGDILTVKSEVCSAGQVVKPVVYSTAGQISINKENRFQEDTTYCGGTSTLTAPLGQSYNWSTGATTPWININSAGTYTVTIVTPCSTFTDTIIVDSTAPPIIDVIQDTVCILSLEETDLVHTSGHLYHWETDANNIYVGSPFDTIPGLVYTGSTNFFAPVDREVNLTVIDTNTGCQNTVDIDIRLHYKLSHSPYVNHLGCEGDSAKVISYTPPYLGDYLYWTAEQDTSTINLITTSGTYLGIYETACGLYFDSINVVINTPDDGINQSDTSICDSATLHFSTNAIAEELIWYNSVNTDTLFYDQFNYSNGTNTNASWNTTSSNSGCNCMRVSSSRMIATAATNGTTTTTFSSNSISADASKAVVFQMKAWEWMNLSHNGEYFSVIVSGLENGSARSDTISKQFFDSPEQIIGEFDSMIVMGVLPPGYTSFSFELKAKVHSSIDQYEFDDILVTQHIAFADTNAIQYNVSQNQDLVLYAQSNYCKFLDTIHIEVNNNNPELVFATDSGCVGDTLQFGLNEAPWSVVWSTGDTGLFTQIIQSDIIFAQVNGSCGQVYTDTVVANIFTNPVINIDGPAISCLNQTDTINASGGLSYIWSNGHTTSEIAVNPTVATSYFVTVSDSGCSSIDSIYLMISSPPVFQLQGPDSACKGDTVFISSTGDSTWTYTWNNGDTNDFLETSFILTNTFSCSAFDGLCMDTNYKTILLASTPQSLTTMSDSNVCLGDTIELIANGSGATSWLGHDSANTSIQVSPDSTTEYIARTSFACSIYDTVLIDTLHLPTPTIVGPGGFCLQENVELSVSQTFQSYTWDDGSQGSTRSLTPATAGTYFVTVYDGFCSGTTQHTLQQHNAVSAGNTHLVSGDSLIFDWLNYDSNATFQWDFGDGTMDSIHAQGVHIYPEPGFYTLCLYVSGPCNSDTNCNKILGLNQDQQDSKNAFLHPNPAHKNFNVNCGNSMKNVVSVYTFDGALVSKKVGLRNIEFYTMNWSAGVYSVVVKNRNSIQTLKLVLH